MFEPGLRSHDLGAQAAASRSRFCAARGLGVLTGLPKNDDCDQDTCAHGELMLSGLLRSLQTVVDPHCVLAEQDAAKLLPRARAGVPMVRLE